MAARDGLTALVDRRLWVYAGGLGGILVVRTAIPPSSSRALTVSLVLGVMVLTYAAELWFSADAPSVRPGVLATGVVGVVVGCWLALRQAPVGLLFVAGGLLFLNRGLVGVDAP